MKQIHKQAPCTTEMNITNMMLREGCMTESYSARFQLSRGLDAGHLDGGGRTGAMARRGLLER